MWKVFHTFGGRLIIHNWWNFCFVSAKKQRRKVKWCAILFSDELNPSSGFPSLMLNHHLSSFFSYYFCCVFFHLLLLLLLFFRSMFALYCLSLTRANQNYLLWVASSYGKSGGCLCEGGLPFFFGKCCSHNLILLLCFLCRQWLSMSWVSNRTHSYL